jgi:alpha-amylase
MKKKFAILLIFFAASLLPAQVFEHPVEDEVFYMVFTDRFEDGDPTNNEGAGASSGGYDPTVLDFYHGGDLRGLINRLDYLEELGITAIWLSPVHENFGIQGSVSGYHGYWIRDFMTIDPHLGTEDDFRELVDTAHEKGMKIYMDIVTNHTADMISFQENVYNYVTKTSQPYTDTEGNSFDDADFAWDGTGDVEFPSMDLNTSFPYTPIAHETPKNPEFLNDLTNYHNRETAPFLGKVHCMETLWVSMGFFTEKQEVVEGFIQIYDYWIREFNVDGFRIDTVLHVNIEFWEAFGQAMRDSAAARDAAAAEGSDDDSTDGTGDSSDSGDTGDNTDGEDAEPEPRVFFQFGEVLNGDPRYLSQYSVTGTIDSTIDFPLAFQLRNWLSQGQSVSVVQTLFDSDDRYIDADSHARARPLFLGNHDIGRWGWFIEQDNPFMGEDQKIDLMEFGHACIMFLRGQPIIYYGDEQGFVGTGTFGGAREDMLPGQTQAYNSVDLIGTDATTADSNFDTEHPIFLAIKSLISFYKEHQAVRGGTQVFRNTNNANVLAVSRFRFDEQIEYIFVGNSSRFSTRTVGVPTFYGEGQVFERVLDSVQLGQTVDPLPTATVGANGELEVSLEPLQFAVYKAVNTIPTSDQALEASFVGLEDGGTIFRSAYSANGETFPGRAEVRVELNTDRPAAVEFAYAVETEEETPVWVPLGIDDNAPYRVYFGPTLPEATSLIQIRASATTIGGRTAEAIVRTIEVGGSSDE